MTLLTVRHTTTYRYKQPVSFGEHRMMFRPRDSYDQKLLEAWLTIKPEPTTMRWVHDVFGNCVTIADFRGRPAKELRFESNIWLDHAPSNAPDFEIEDYAQKYPFTYTPEEISDLLPAITPQYPDPDQVIHTWVRQFLRKGGTTDTGMLLMTLTYAFKEGFTYERRTEPGTRPPAETLRLKRGSCRDLALLMIEALRSLGFAARFVSGYLYVPSRDWAAARWVAVRPTPGARCICRVRDGSSSIPPTPSSAIAISFAWPWRAIRARRFLYQAPFSVTPAISST